MKQIRHGVFETNSSSTHSIAIPKQHAKEYPKVISFRIGNFGWEWEKVNPADYLYTAIFAHHGCNNDASEQALNKVKNALETYNIAYDMQEPQTYWWEYGGSSYCFLDEGGIDHPEDLEDFLDAVLKDNETILDFIFYGIVLTGNDNSDSEERCFIRPDLPTYEEWLGYDKKTGEEKIIQHKNPYYDKKYAEDYDWYMKGN